MTKSDQDQALVAALHAKIARLERHPAVLELEATRDYLAMLARSGSAPASIAEESALSVQSPGEDRKTVANLPAPAIPIPQAVNGRRLRPGTLRYQIISGVIQFLWDKEQPTHRKDILRYLQQHGVLNDLDEASATYRLANIFSGARDMFVTNKDGFWSLTPAARVGRPSPHARRNRTEARSE